MPKSITWIVLAALIAAGTAFVAWWMVPAAGAVWGLTRAAERGVWWKAGLAAALGWASLIALNATQGRVSEVARVLGGIFALPGFVMIVLTLGFAAALAGSAAQFTALLISLFGGREHRRREAF
jgi:hypothetical protein